MPKYLPARERAHPTGAGVQRLYRFHNDYGASVVRFGLSFMGAASKALLGRYGSYTDNEAEWEVAVLRFTGPDVENNFELDYGTPITDDVIGHVHDDNLEELLGRIAALPAPGSEPISGPMPPP